MANGMIGALVLSSVIMLAACKPEVQQAPERYPSAWDTEAVSEGTSFEDRIAWALAESDYPKERLFLDTRAPEGRLNSESWPVLRMSKPYGCEVESIDVAVDKQLFEVEIWDHFTDVIIVPAFDSGRIAGNDTGGDAIHELWDSSPFWRAFRTGEEIALKLSWECEYPEALPAQEGTLVTYSLTGADYALYYVTGGSS